MASGLIIAVVVVLVVLAAVVLAAPRGSGACTDSSQCGGATPYCVGGSCAAACTDDGQCPGETPWCASGVCVVPPPCGLDWPACQTRGDFQTYSGAWPVGQYGSPTTRDSSWAIDALAQPPAATAAECEAACQEGCSGYEFDVANKQCALWPWPRAAALTDGAGTEYADAVAQDLYGARIGPDTTPSCGSANGAPCWQSPAAPGYDLYTWARIGGDATPTAGSHKLATLGACAAACDGTTGCDAWELSGSDRSSPDGITATNAGWCSMKTIGPSGCVQINPQVPLDGRAPVYSGVRSGPAQPYCA